MRWWLVCFTQREDLPKQDAVGPHVTLGGEQFVKDGLGRHPLQWETGLTANQSTGATVTSHNYCEENVLLAEKAASHTGVH